MVYSLCHTTTRLCVYVLLKKLVPITDHELGNKLLSSDLYTLNYIIIQNISGHRLEKFTIYGSEESYNPLAIHNLQQCVFHLDPVRDGATETFKCGEALQVRCVY